MRRKLFVRYLAHKGSGQSETGERREVEAQRRLLISYHSSVCIAAASSPLLLFRRARPFASRKKEPSNSRVHFSNRSLFLGLLLASGPASAQGMQCGNDPLRTLLMTPRSFHSSSFTSSLLDILDAASATQLNPLFNRNQARSNSPCSQTLRVFICSSSPWPG